MAKFYGWTHEYILDLDSETISLYWEAITMIEAQEVLINMRLADYPNMKKDDRSKWHGQLNRQAYPRDDDSKPLSSEEASAIIGALLNG